MRMLLTSNGVSNDLIRETFADLLGKPFGEAKIVAIIDAILPFGGDSSKLLSHLQGVQDLGWRQFDVLSLFAGPQSLVETRLRDADVIFCYGGSNHWLAHAWTATGLAPVLAELLESKVYLGWSAGSMIFSRAHDAVVAEFDDEKDEVAMFGLSSASAAVPLFDWFVLCHLNAPYFPNQTDEWAAAVAARLGSPVYFLDDDSALLVRDPDADPEVISTGHWLRLGG
ncbi:MAG: Type 1 glutamine amidotransferase-like domain-containing protein [Pseudolysinimonas sp.]